MVHKERFHVLIKLHLENHTLQKREERARYRAPGNDATRVVINDEYFCDSVTT